MLEVENLLGEFPGLMWEQAGSAWICGDPHDVRRLRSELVDEASTMSDSSNLAIGPSGDELVNLAVRLVRSMDGAWSGVWVTGREVVLACDIVARIPLFYRVAKAKGATIVKEGIASASGIAALDTSTGDSNRVILVTDRAASIASGTVDEWAAREYLTFTYVLGAETLDPEVKQVRAGEVVRIDRVTGAVTTTDAWLFRRTYDGGTDLAELRDLMLRAAERMVEGSNGAPFAISLSGGLDSRTVAWALAELGERDVVTYTYSYDVNVGEAPAARSTAKRLGFDWYPLDTRRLFMPYYEGHWREQSFSAFQLGRMPSLSYGLNALIERGLIQRGAIMLPGHTGDFIFGGHLLPESFLKRTWTDEDVVTQIVRRHGTYDFRTGFSAKMRERLLGLVNATDPVGSEEFACRLDGFDARERQAKFILTDSWSALSEDCQIRTMLWDRELTEWVLRIPLRDLYGRRIQMEFVNRYVNPSCGLPPEPVPIWNESAERAAKRSLAKLRFSKMPGMPRLFQIYRAVRQTVVGSHGDGSFFTLEHPWRLIAEAVLRGRYWYANPVVVNEILQHWREECAQLSKGQ